MTKLHQLIAIEKDVKARVDATVTGAYHLLQKPDMFSGLIRTYQPRDDDGDQMPPESKKVLARVPLVITDIQAALERLIDLSASKDMSNTVAFADIKVGDVALATGVPVTTLLWLEKKVIDLRTILQKLPTLAPEEDWTWDTGTNQYRSDTAVTSRTKKVDDFVTIAPATDKHPAQVAKVTKDPIVGDWSTTKLSGAISVVDRDKYLVRVDMLLEAVKKAREEANTILVTDVHIGNSLLNFVFSG